MILRSAQRHRATHGRNAIDHLNERGLTLPYAAETSLEHRRLVALACDIVPRYCLVDGEDTPSRGLFNVVLRNLMWLVPVRARASPRMSVQLHGQLMGEKASSQLPGTTAPYRATQRGPGP